MYSISERIEDKVNAAGLRASCAVLSAVEDFHPPRWMVVTLGAAVGHILLLDLKGELHLRAFLISMLETFL